MKYLTVICCALVAFAAAAPQAPAPAAASEKKSPPTLPGGCPQFNAVASFDATKIPGEWFIVHGAKHGIVKETGKCLSKTVTAKPDGSFEVKASGIKSDNQKKTKTFTSTPIAGSPGKFNLAGEDQEPGFTKTLTFLDTDYTNYAVTVTCITNGQVHGLLTVVNSRGKTLSTANLEKAKATLKAQNLSEDLTAIEQNC